MSDNTRVSTDGLKSTQARIEQQIRDIKKRLAGSGVVSGKSDAITSRQVDVVEDKMRELYREFKDQIRDQVSSSFRNIRKMNTSIFELKDTIKRETDSTKSGYVSADGRIEDGIRIMHQRMDKYFAVDGKFDKLKDQLSVKLDTLETNVGKNKNANSQDMSNVRQQVNGLKYRLDNYEPKCCQTNAENLNNLNQSVVGKSEQLEQILNHVRREGAHRQTAVEKLKTDLVTLTADLKNVDSRVMSSDNEADSDRAELLKNLNKLKQDFIRVNYTMNDYVNFKVSGVFVRNSYFHCGHKIKKNLCLKICVF